MAAFSFFLKTTYEINSSVLFYCLFIYFYRSSRSESIYIGVMRSDDELTKQRHEIFWSEINKIESNREIEIFKESALAELIGAQKFQREIWVSIKSSYEQQRVVKTKLFEEMAIELLSRYSDSLTFDKDSSEYLRATTSYQNKLKSSSAKADILIS